VKLGVVIPSRLAPRPGGRHLRDFGPELWLDGALASVTTQTCYSPCSWQVFVGVDPRATVPLHVYDHAHVVRARRPGQAAAVNAAADVARQSSDVLLFLEDDDRWLSSKTTAELPHLNTAPFVSCSQREVTEDGTLTGRCDYPTPSTWLMLAEVWDRVPHFDEDTRFFVDTEWLGRLNEAKVPRVHLVEAGVVPTPNHLHQVGRFSEVVGCLAELPVTRTVNTRGGMAEVRGAARDAADLEAQVIRRRFGCDPW